MKPDQNDSPDPLTHYFRFWMKREKHKNIYMAYESVK